MVTVADLVDFDDPVYKARKEVAELEEILPDIMGKVCPVSCGFNYYYSIIVKVSASSTPNLPEK